MKELQTGHPFPLVLLASLAENRESDLHRKFAEHRTSGEWFAPCPALLEFIAGIRGEDSAALLRDSIASASLPKSYPLFVQNVLAEFPGKVVMVDRTEAGDEPDEWDEVFAIDEAIHSAHEVSFDGPADPDKTCDGGSTDCECESCSIMAGAGHLAGASPAAFIVFPGGPLYAVCRWPSQDGMRRIVADALREAMWELDAVHFTLHAIFYNDDGTHDVSEILATAGWYDRPREEWRLSRSD